MTETVEKYLGYLERVTTQFGVPFVLLSAVLWWTATFVAQPLIDSHRDFLKVEQEAMRTISKAFEAQTSILQELRHQNAQSTRLLEVIEQRMREDRTWHTQQNPTAK